MNKAAKIKYAIRYNPTLISILLQDTSINKGMLYRLLKKAIPCRIGIEFELAGCFYEGFFTENKEYLETFKDRSLDNINLFLTKYYKVKEIKCDAKPSECGTDTIRNNSSLSSYVNLTDPEDNHSHRIENIRELRDADPDTFYSTNEEMSLREARQIIEAENRRLTQENPEINNRYEGLSIVENSTVKTKTNEPLQEVRISLSNFRHLVGLYLFMQDMIKYCKLHEGGGIHIHIDMSMFDFHNTEKEKEIQRYITNRLTSIGKIFPRYKGKYNKRKVGIRTKGSWVNISRLNTFEFRTAPLTFDYPTLIEWVAKLVRFRQTCIHECKLVEPEVLKEIREKKHGIYYKKSVNVSNSLNNLSTSSSYSTSNYHYITVNGDRWTISSS